MFGCIFDARLSGMGLCALNCFFHMCGSSGSEYHAATFYTQGRDAFPRFSQPPYISLAVSAPMYINLTRLRQKNLLQLWTTKCPLHSGPHALPKGAICTVAG
jgi:hypothetical protein